MPALPNVADCVRVQMYFNLDGSIEGGTSFHLSYTSGPPAGSDLTTFASDIAGDWNTNFASLWPTEQSLVKVVVTDIASTSGAIGIWTGSHAGTSGSGPTTASVCAVLNHQISRRYRGGKPRNYMPGVTVTQLTGLNEISSGAQTDIAAAWSGMVSDILAHSFSSFTLQNIISVSYYDGFTVVTNPITGRSRNVPTLRATPVQDVIHSTTCAQKLGSQRRRLRI